MKAQCKNKRGWIPACAGMTSYICLMRLHQPVGIWLLLWPCWWSLALAGASSWLPYGLFALGAVVMRSAGCIINDIIDRDIDKQVERTKNRPLASGAVSLAQAMMLLAVLLLVALGVAVLLGTTVLLWSVAALPLVALYPLMKRITWWPQLFLGLTFNWGALVGWAAVRGEVAWPALLLYAACVFWTLGYDTIYAHQDKIDDAKIGVKSTARRLGDHTKLFLLVFYALFSALFFLALLMSGITIGWMLAAICVVAVHLLWQVCVVSLDKPESCLRVFKSNTTFGGIVFLMIVFA